MREVLAYAQEINRDVHRNVQACVNMPVTRDDGKAAKALVDDAIEQLQKLSGALQAANNMFVGRHS